MSDAFAAGYWKTRYETDPWKPLSPAIFALGMALGFLLAGVFQ